MSGIETGAPRHRRTAEPLDIVRRQPEAAVLDPRDLLREGAFRFADDGVGEGIVGGVRAQGMACEERAGRREDIA